MCCGSAERPPGLLAPHQFGALGFSKLQARGHTGATALPELGKHVKAKHSKAQAEHSKMTAGEGTREQRGMPVRAAGLLRSMQRRAQAM